MPALLITVALECVGTHRASAPVSGPGVWIELSLQRALLPFFLSKEIDSGYRQPLHTYWSLNPDSASEPVVWDAFKDLVGVNTKESS